MKTEDMRNKVSGGWVKIYVQPAERDAMKDAGCWPDKMHVNSPTAWVPRWVKDAIKAFKSGGGFADMPLAEYLRAMKP